MAATGLTVYGQCVSVAMPWFVMYTAMDVYQAPQMKNWRNIIVDSFVRITASRSPDREFFRQMDDDVRPRWQDDVRVLGLMGHRGAGGAADDATDDRALLVAAEDATEDRAGGSARSHLGDVTRGGAAPFVNRFERVDRRVERVRGAAYSDARNTQRQGPGTAGIGRWFDVGDLAVDDRACRKYDAPRGVPHVFDDARGEWIAGFRGPRRNRVGRGDVDRRTRAEARHCGLRRRRRRIGTGRWRRRWRPGRRGWIRRDVVHLSRRFRGCQRQVAGGRIGGLALLLSLLAGTQAHGDGSRQDGKTVHKVLSVTAVVYRRTRVGPAKIAASIPVSTRQAA